jgi:general secretion pathway protein J
MKQQRPNMGKLGRGFTLLELILALSLTGLLLSMLSAGVYTVVSNWRRETTTLDDTLDKSLVLLQVERALLAAVPHSYIDLERVSRFIYFEGSEHEIRFVSMVSPQRRTGLTAWRLVSTPGEGVMLALTPAFSDNPDDRFEALDLQPLLPGYEVELRYLVQRNPQRKEWLDEWVGRDMQSLPIAVLVRFVPDDDQEQTLEIVAPVKAWRHDQIDPTIPVT